MVAAQGLWIRQQHAAALYTKFGYPVESGHLTDPERTGVPGSAVGCLRDAFPADGADSRDARVSAPFGVCGRGQALRRDRAI
jgi:hypothetical protein